MKNENRELFLQRLRYLTEEFSFIEAEISNKLQRLKSISAEMADIYKSLHGSTDLPSEEDSLMVNGVQISPSFTEPVVINGVKIRRNTIKDYVVQVLSDSKKGMTALDILYEINTRFDKSYDRPSLSPQLSRLKEDGVLGLRGSVWYLKPENDIFD